MLSASGVIDLSIWPCMYLSGMRVRASHPTEILRALCTASGRSIHDIGPGPSWWCAAYQQSAAPGAARARRATQCVCVCVCEYTVYRACV